MRFALAALLASMLMSQSACNDLECGIGTSEMNGVCVAPDYRPGDPVTCGRGTHFDPLLFECVPDFPPVICPTGTAPFVNEDGLVQCPPPPNQGCGIPCKNPDPGLVTICGRLTGLTRSVDMDAGTGAPCDPDDPTVDGACSMSVQVFDALQFAANPTGAPELVPRELVLNDCGFYMAHNIPTPMLGYLAVVGDDHPGTGVDTWTRSGSARAVVAGQRITGESSIVISHATDAMWTAIAGDPFGGMTFSERGTYMPIFVTGLAENLRPIAGVKITVNGSVEPALDYYFTDTDPFTYTTLSAAQDATGANGAALVVDTDLTNHSATGGEPTDTALGQEGVPCVWPEDLGDAIPGTFFALHRHARNSFTAEKCE